MHIVKELRIALDGISQQQLADKLKIGQRAVCHWELCKKSPSLKNISSLWKLIEKNKLQNILHVNHQQFCDRLQIK